MEQWGWPIHTPISSRTIGAPTDVQDKVGLPLITENEINRIKEIWAEEITDLALLDAGVEI